MSRSQLKQITLANVLAVGLASTIKGSEIKFTGTIGGVDLCDADGKIKKYASVDVLIGQIVKQNPYATELTFTVNVAGLVVPKVPKDPVADATARKAMLQAQASNNTAKVSDLTTLLTRIASYEESPFPQLVAQFNEVTAQKTALVAYGAWLSDAIADCDAIIGA